METQDFYYLSEQILCYLNEHKEDQFVIEKCEITQALRLDICDYDCAYDKPAWLNDLYASKRIYKDSTGTFKRYEYVEFFLSIGKSDKRKEIPITVRIEPLDKADMVTSKGRNSLKRTAFFKKSGYIDKQKGIICVSESNETKDIESGFKNLIIIDSSKEHDDLAFQIGIYLYQEKVSQNKMELYILFEAAYKRIFLSRFVNSKLSNSELEKIYDRREDTINFDTEYGIFSQLVERFCIPNTATSFESYIKLLLKRLNNSNLRNEYSSDEIYGVNKQTLHTQIRRNKIEVTKKASGKYDWEQARPLIEGYKKNLDEKKLWSVFSNIYAKKLADARGIELESARRILRRWKRKGFSIRAMAEKVKLPPYCRTNKQQSAIDCK